VLIATANRRISVRCERTPSRSQTAGHADPRFGETFNPGLTGPVVSIAQPRGECRCYQPIRGMNNAAA
jgi:hypothetical protein